MYLLSLHRPRGAYRRRLVVWNLGGHRRVPETEGFTPKISMLKINRVLQSSFIVILSVTRMKCYKVAHIKPDQPQAKARDE